MKEFVYKKGKHYLKNIIFFKIINIPSRLNEGKMNDDKLTFEEYAIRDKLLAQNVPFKLVDHSGTGYGLWGDISDTLPSGALIALEPL